MPAPTPGTVKHLRRVWGTANEQLVMAYNTNPLPYHAAVTYDRGEAGPKLSPSGARAFNKNKNE